MSIEIVNTPIAGNKVITERTYFADQDTPLGDPNDGAGGSSNYTATVLRERVTSIEGLTPTINRTSIAPVAGEPAEGTDGTDPSHYVNAEVGFDAEIKVHMTDILLYPDEDTVTVGSLTVPAKVVPLLLAATYDLVSQKHNLKKLNNAIENAIQLALAGE